MVMQGDMDAASMKGQKALLEEIAERNEDVVIDMTNVGFIDSSGVGGIVFLYKRLTANERSLQLRGVSGQPLQLLSHLRLSNLIAR
jgi:anti-anti-sigma factor